MRLYVFVQRMRRRWHEKCGYREILVLAVPLILSTGAWAIQHFVDRMFLTWYSPETIAAAMPSGILNFTLMSLFIGTAGYVSTFVAQYFGAKRYERIGPALWQGIYIALGVGVAFLGLIPLAEPLFHSIGHGETIAYYETVYFRVLCLGAFPVIASASMSGFFAGLGRTWPVMWVNIAATAVNLVLDYAMIFGKWGFAERGIEGAAIATVFSGFFGFFAYVVLLFRPSYDRQYHTLRGWRFDKALFLRLLRFGVPSGAQFFLDMIGFTAFVLFMGRLGIINLAATNIAFNINTLAFMPMIGFGIAVSVLVGQHLGENNPTRAEYSVYSGFHITIIYMMGITALYVLTPQLFLLPYASQADPATFEPIRKLAVILLRFVAVYSIFDAMTIIFASALKGAGDTRYVMFAMLFMTSLLFILPSYLALVVYHAGIYTGWAIASVYIMILGCSFFLRFVKGKWKSMRVIEEVPPFTAPRLPENPISEYEL